MKSVTLLTVLLIAAVASAGVQIIIDPPVAGVGRAGILQTKTTLVKALADPGSTVTTVLLQFTGPMIQQWDMDYIEDPLGGEGTWVMKDPAFNAYGSLQPTGNIRDSRFVPTITASIPQPPWDNVTNPQPFISVNGNYFENMNGGQEVAGGLYHYWYGKGTVLGDTSGEGMAFGFMLDVTAANLAQIVMDANDFNTSGVHVTGAYMWKTLDPDGTGPLTETTGRLDIDQWIGLVPEPASITLLAIGAVAAFIRRRRA